MTKEQLIKEFREKFGWLYTMPAGSELLKDDIYDLEQFYLSAFDAGRASGIEECKAVKEELENYKGLVRDIIKSNAPSSSKDN